ncbi:MAG: class I SAM-dependent methyltransferase [Egibacteraceae bacterium]
MSTPTTANDSGWQLRGSAAEAYEAHLVPAIFDAMSARLVAAAEVEAGDCVLDVAWGTGVVARAAAQRAGAIGAVTGVDVNPDMLATARRAAAGITPSIAFEQADATDLPFDDGAFDVVVCQEALQFFSDRSAALREMRRVTRPGGRMACSVFRSLDHHRVYAVFARALGEHAGTQAAEMMGSPFALGDADLLRQAVSEAGWDAVEIRIAVSDERFPSVTEFVRQEAASSPLAGPLSKLADDQHAALVATLEQRLSPYLDDGGLVFPNETHIITGRAT